MMTGLSAWDLGVEACRHFFFFSVFEMGLDSSSTMIGRRLTLFSRLRLMRLLLGAVPRRLWHSLSHCHHCDSYPRADNEWMDGWINEGREVCFLARPPRYARARY